MGTHTAPVNRAGSNASDTSVAIAFSWAISAGTGTNPVNAADFPGGVFPSGSGTIPAGSASATITFQSNPDTTFETDETGILTLTTTQNGITVTGSPQPFTITNDDANPGSSTVVYGPSNVADSGLVAVGSPNMRVEFTFKSATIAGSIMVGLDANGNGAALYQLNDQQCDIRKVTAFVVDSTPQGGSAIPNTFDENSLFGVELRGGRIYLYEGDTLVSPSADGYNVSGLIAGNNGRYLKYGGAAGAVVTGLRIIRL